MHAIDARNALTLAFFNFAKANGATARQAQEFADEEMDAVDERLADSLPEPDTRDVPLDTPSLDTSFHDHEMEI